MKAEKTFGDLPLAAFEDWRVRKEFLDWRERVAKESGLREADHRLSTISAMLGRGARKAIGQPTQRIQAPLPQRPGRNHLAPGAYTRFHEGCTNRTAARLVIALHTGQREGDLLRLPWSAYDGETLRLRQGKSRRGKKLGALITIPTTEALRRMLDGMERKSPLILSTKTGRSFKKRYFSQAWNKVMKKAGIEHIVLPDIPDPVRLHFHDLRGTTITLLSEAGPSPQQIATITGHSLKSVYQIFERYLARTSGLSEQAIANFENSPRTKFANQLQTGAPEEKPVNEK